jgi:hypothetical protein
MRRLGLLGWVACACALVLGMGCGSSSNGGGGAGGSGAKSAASATSGGVPCDVAKIVSANCTVCHATVPQAGAVMSLMKLSDFHAAAKSDPKQKVYEIMPGRLHAMDIKRRMPPASQRALSAGDLATLTDWLKAGAVGSKQACAITEAGKGSTGGQAGATGGSDAGQLATGSGGIQMSKITYNDPLMKCYLFLAHASGDKMQPFSVSTMPDQYINFEFAAPWTGMTYARSYASSIDNGAVVHHWLFYMNAMGMKSNDGMVSPSAGAHPGGQLVNGWAPGGTPSYFDPDVGTEMPDSATYTLEIHYNNMTGSPAPDASGIEVCVTPTEPKYVASVSWLGTDNISGTMASGTCAPTTGQRSHIIGATPHMHVKGKRMQVVLKRADGSMETLHDMPFDFNYQIGYSQDTWVEPGDSITTTCYYDAPATFGQKTSDEMCYWFAMYYPKLALTNMNPIGRLIHGPNSCLN